MNIIHGDCLEELKKLEDNSIDAVVCDPPYGLSNTKPQQVADVLKAWVTGDTVSVPAKRGGFMGKDWDSFVPPPAVWEECMRVLKPGGHMAVFAGARTQDLMGLSIRLAGFEIRDTLGWIYGSGMPKSLDISKAIDKKRDDNNDWKAVGSFLKSHRVSAGYATRNSFADKILNGHSNLASAAANLSNWENGLSFPTWERWEQLKGLLDLPDEMDAEVWRLNGRKGTPGEAWEKREVVGRAKGAQAESTGRYGAWGNDRGDGISEYNLTAPATSEAQRWEGWGTALKPAIEPIILARKPLDGTVANNVLAHGVGGLNIDACRVPGKPRTTHKDGNHRTKSRGDTYKEGFGTHGAEPAPAGRFPANVLLDEHAAKEMDKQSGIVPSGGRTSARNAPKFSNGVYGQWSGAEEKTYAPDTGGASRYFPVFKSEEETPETKGHFPANVLLDKHAAAEMDEQSGVLKSGGFSGTVQKARDSQPSKGAERERVREDREPDSGGASRFFPVFKYQAKAPKKERPVIEREAIYGLRDDLTPEQVDHVRARLQEVGLEIE